MSNTMQRPSRPAVSPPWSTDLVAAGAAVVCALVLWGSLALTDAKLTVQWGSEVQSVGGVAVATAAGVSAVAGLVVLRMLERVTSRALALWTTLAAAVGLLSLAGPLTATSTAATGALVSLHAVVAAVVIASAHASRRRRRR